jgi:hypothetical protein
MKQDCDRWCPTAFYRRWIDASERTYSFVDDKHCERHEGGSISVWSGFSSAFDRESAPHMNSQIALRIAGL